MTREPQRLATAGHVDLFFSFGERYDGGRLDRQFTERTDIKVRVIAVGTGAALRMGREGNADLLLTHAPASEQVLVEDSGHFQENSRLSCQLEFTEEINGLKLILAPEF